MLSCELDDILEQITVAYHMNQREEVAQAAEGRSNACCVRG